MNRRDTVFALLALGAAPFAVEAQSTRKTAKLPVLGILSGFSKPTPEQTAEAEKSPIGVLMKERGWIRGKTFLIENAYGEGSEERMPELAAELVRKGVDVIWAQGPEAAVAAARATKTIPIVFHGVSLPIELGLVESYARPGRNVTGIGYVADLEIYGKLVELLLQVVPAAKRLAYIGNVGTFRTVSDGDFQAIRVPVEAAAKRFKIEIRYYPLRRPVDFNAVFPAILEWKAQALLDLGSPITFRERRRIVKFASENRLPCVSMASAIPDAGGLFSYGLHLSNSTWRSFDYVARILGGAKPADLPVQLPSEIQLVVNLRTAKALGITVPQSVLVRADRVIE